MNDTQIQAIFAGLVVLSGIVTFFVSRRHNEEIEDTDAAGRSITAIADAAETLVGPLTEELKRVSAVCVSHQKQIAILTAHVAVLEQQVSSLGADPHPAPARLDAEKRRDGNVDD